MCYGVVRRQPSAVHRRIRCWSAGHARPKGEPAWPGCLQVHQFVVLICFFVEFVAYEVPVAGLVYGCFWCLCVVYETKTVFRPPLAHHRDSLWAVPQQTAALPTVRSVLVAVYCCLCTSIHSLIARVVVSLYVLICACLYVCVSVCLYVCVYVCLSVCVCVCSECGSWSRRLHARAAAIRWQSAHHKPSP